jgi:hypothetical protein
MEEAGITDVKTREMELLMQGLGARCTGQIELAAQMIQDQTEDPLVRENAILWKVNAIPLFYQASFTPDPVGALIRIWVLGAQMRHFFTTGAGREVFGDQQSVGVATAVKIERETEELGRRLITSEKVDDFKPQLEAWVNENPFQNMLFVRPGDSYDFLMKLAGYQVGGLAATASLNSQLESINDRIATFTTSVPKQVQWQTELLMARTPDLIEAQRDSTLAAIRLEYIALLEPMLKFLQEERIAFTQDMEKERIAVLTTLQQERLEVLEVLTDQLIVALDRISEERIATLTALNETSSGTMAQMMVGSKEIAGAAIDRIFSKMVQIMILPSLVLLALVVIAMRILYNAHRRHLEVLAAIRGERS